MRILSTLPIPSIRPIPLSVDNKLPAIEMRFGTNPDTELQFMCHLDSCAGMNTGNLALHQWVITNHPDIVDSYEECNDANPFHPLMLDCAVPTADSKESLDGKLTAVVTYFASYKLKDGSPALLKFGLGKDIKVNAIVGLPMWRSWQLILDLYHNKYISPTLGLWFPLLFDDAASGLPSHISWDSSQFVRSSKASCLGFILVDKLPSSSPTESDKKIDKK